MSTGTHLRARLAGASLWTTLLIVLLAVFAMHGLASHATTHGDSAPQALPSAVPAGEPQHAPHRHAIEEDVPTTDSAQHLPSSGHGTAGGACLAVLYLLAVMIALAIRRGTPIRPHYVARRRRSRPPTRGRSLDPPCLHRLSILRC